MEWTAAAYGAALIAALWIGVKPLLKRGKYREYMLYAFMVVWSAYLFASEHFGWLQVTLVTLTSFLLSPIVRFFNLMSWLG